MPELPEVEIVRRGLEPALVNKTVRGVDIWRYGLRKPIPKNFAALLTGQKVLKTERRGKYILAFLESGNGFALHLGMSGRIKIIAKNKSYEREKHDHVGIVMENGTRIIFNDPRRFGMIFPVTEKDWAQAAPFAAMGLEPLSPEFTGERLYENMRRKKTPIKTALLDQRVVAGVGNIYASEALFDSGIQPQRLASSVTKKESMRLAAAIRAVLEKAIKAGGSSLRDYKHTDGELGYFQHHFSVYDREGIACPGCSCNPLKTGGIRRIVQAGRSTFYCPEKQD